ncbi:patatin family phospholipase [Bifidobacterium minimum]|uniref:Patatin family phospholipase n=1 Tax=Bifidobacterium minimum TaxID=1693 RepID=A0A087BPR2_9BIFI|nr:patatin family protein [Bifidobacterium minimum]KFI73012.1 patatin family phospholipase [Bifidobacterium minimum]
MTGTALIDVGGGYRAIYGAGVMDRCLDEKISFDHCYGVSAGSANMTSFIAGQNGRSHRFYTEYSFRKEYASPSNFFKDHNFVDLDYVYGTLSNHDGEYPLDYEAFEANPAEFTVIACDARDGAPHYFTKSDVGYDNYDIMKASSAVPVACEPYYIGGVPYFDGGIADPVPVHRAAAEGYDRIVLVLTRPKDVLREQRKDIGPSKVLARTWPAAAEKLLNRYRLYNDEVALAKRYEKEGNVLILAPEDLYGLSTLTKSYEGLERMYRQGYADASRIADFLTH